MAHDNGLPIRGPPNLPSLEFEGKLMRHSTMDVKPPSEADALSENDDNSSHAGSIDDQFESTKLGTLLRNCMLPNANNSTKSFLPAKLVAEKVTVDMIEQELSRLSVNNARKATSAADIHQNYVIVFCVLCAIEKGEAIWDFVEAGISDTLLPLHKKPGTAWSLESRKSQSRLVSDVYNNIEPGVPNTPASNDSTTVRIPGFRNWKDIEKEAFIDIWQWRLTVPFFEMGRGNSALQHYFSPEVVLPWGPLRPLLASEANKSANAVLKPSNKGEGGFGLVESVEIDGDCHGFHDLLEKIGLRSNKFALKTLKSSDFNNEAQFQNEMKQLGRFNGLTNRHIVTLLTCFTQNDKFHFLFPLAECDMESYFERFPKGPVKSPDTVRWFADQFEGLMGALSAIHNPTRISDKFGRHGDLKPDNILWYRETGDVSSGNEPSNKPSGLFVISDLGLSALNGQFSRSNIPNQRISKTPGYRPPECDIKDGKVNQAYDIWTIGCIFMEICVWMLGGNEWLQEFQTDRVSTVYLTGAGSDIFFDILEQEGSKGTYFQRVKPVVTKWFEKMRNHKDSSKFYRDILDIIEHQMIIVMSEKKKRSQSGDLARQLGGIKESCTQDSYCITPVSDTVPQTSRPEVFPVDALLNSTARDMIRENRPRLETYSGRSVPPALSVD